MNADVQFEVVFSLERLLADLALEPPANAVSGEVASEVSLAWKNLLVRKKRDFNFFFFLIDLDFL